MSAGFLTVLCLAAATLDPPSRQAIQDTLNQPLVTPGVVYEEVGAFVRARVPQFQPPADLAAWEQDRTALREAFLDQVVFRGVPDSWQARRLSVEMTEKIETSGGYSIQKLRYEALPGLWIPALLYLPDELQSRTPAVLNVNGHVGPPGKANEEDQIRSINLAKRGIIAMHPEWFSFGELQGEEYSHNRLAYLDLVGVSGLSVFYLALQRALDVLEDHPQVDGDRIVVTGLSGGGWQTIVISALDPRVSACAPNAGYIGLEVRTQYPSDIGDLEQIPSDLLTAGDYTHLTALLAPRPTLLIYNAKDECCFKADHSVPAIYDPLLPWYQLYGAADRFTHHINEEPGTHNYGQDNREAFYAFLKREVVPEAAWDAKDLPVDELRTPEALHVGLPEENENFPSLAKAMLAQQETPAIPDAPSSRWKKRQRERLAGKIAFSPAKVTESTSTQNETPELMLESWILRIDGSWTLPGVLIRTSGSSDRLSIIVSDEGMASVLEQAAAQVASGHSVLLIDPLFLGQTKPEGNLYQYPMLINSTGARALGIQVAQTLAATAWAREQGWGNEIHLLGIGYNASTIARMSAALSETPFAEVHVESAPDSLFKLVEEMVHYNDQAPLFVFGLLPEFDVPVLDALAASLHEQEGE